MNDIKFDKRNYRIHNIRNKELIKKSLQECGAGRSIVIDNDGEIIAGNGVYEQVQELGIKTRIIETDGTELIAVKRTDLQTDDEKRKKLAILDNSTSDSSEFDLNLLNNDFEKSELEQMGVYTVDYNDVDMDSFFNKKDDEKKKKEKQKSKVVCPYCLNEVE